MASFSEVLHGQVSPELVTAIDTMLLAKQVSENPPTTVTSGAIPVTTRATLLSVTGTKAYTLADGLFEGQRKTIRCTVAASTPAGTVTPATASGFTSLAFDAVEDMAELEWHAGGWRLAASVAVSVT